MEISPGIPCRRQRPPLDELRLGFWAGLVFCAAAPLAIADPLAATNAPSSPAATALTAAPSAVASPAYDPRATTPQVFTGPGRHVIAAKLAAIQLNVAWDKLPLNEALRGLARQTQRLDPEKIGVNFLINNNAYWAPAAPGTDPVALDVSGALVTLKLTNVTLNEALDAIALVAEPPLQYSIQDFGVVFSARTSGTAAGRTFKVNPDTFYQGLESVGAKSFGGSAASGSTGANAPTTGGAVVPTVNIAPGQQNQLPH